MGEMVTMVDRLTYLKQHLPEQHFEEMDNCILIAANLDRLAKSEHAHTRIDSKETSRGNVTQESLSKGQRLLWRVFEEHPDDAMDELTMQIRYELIHRVWDDTEDHWILPKTSTVRARRPDLEKMGMIVLVDKEGTSLTGRPAGRYQKAPTFKFRVRNQRRPRVVSNE